MFLTTLDSATGAAASLYRRVTAFAVWMRASRIRAFCALLAFACAGPVLLGGAVYHVETKALAAADVNIYTTTREVTRVRLRHLLRLLEDCVEQNRPDADAAAGTCSEGRDSFASMAQSRQWSFQSDKTLSGPSLNDMRLETQLQLDLLDVPRIEYGDDLAIVSQLAQPMPFAIAEGVLSAFGLGAFVWLWIVGKSSAAVVRRPSIAMLRRQALR